MVVIRNIFNKMERQRFKMYIPLKISTICFTQPLLVEIVYSSLKNIYNHYFQNINSVKKLKAMYHIYDF